MDQTIKEELLQIIDTWVLANPMQKNVRYATKHTQANLVTLVKCYIEYGFCKKNQCYEDAFGKQANHPSCVQISFEHSYVQKLLTVAFNEYEKLRSKYRRGIKDLLSVCENMIFTDLEKVHTDISGKLAPRSFDQIGKNDLGTIQEIVHGKCGQSFKQYSKLEAMKLYRELLADIEAQKEKLQEATSENETSLEITFEDPEERVS